MSSQPESGFPPLLLKKVANLHFFCHRLTVSLVNENLKMILYPENLIFVPFQIRYLLCSWDIITIPMNSFSLNTNLFHLLSLCCDLPPPHNSIQLLELTSGYYCLTCIGFMSTWNLRCRSHNPDLNIESQLRQRCFQSSMTSVLLFISQR
jgi:hypothetical protein